MTESTKKSAVRQGHRIHQDPSRYTHSQTPSSAYYSQQKDECDDKNGRLDMQERIRMLQRRQQKVINNGSPPPVSALPPKSPADFSKTIIQKKPPLPAPLSRNAEPTFHSMTMKLSASHKLLS